jgi:hypothetical protein
MRSFDYTGARSSFGQVELLKIPMRAWLARHLMRLPDRESDFDGIMRATSPPLALKCPPEDCQCCPV